MIDSDIDIVYCVCVLITETSKRIKQKQIADLLYSCRAVENQKIKREKRENRRTGEERREKKKKERELVAGVASGP